MAKTGIDIPAALIALDSDSDPAAMARKKAFITTHNMKRNNKKTKSWPALRWRPARKYKMTPKAAEQRKVMGMSTTVKARASTKG